MNAKFSAAVAALALGMPSIAPAQQLMPSEIVGADSAIAPYEYASPPAIADQFVIEDPSCNVGCTEQLSCSDSCCEKAILFGLIKQSDHCFDSFISPMTNPVFFEDPRQLTEARAIFLNHKVPLAATSKSTPSKRGLVSPIGSRSLQPKMATPSRRTRSLPTVGPTLPQV